MGRIKGIAIFLACLPSFAWGPEGHRLVARIAFAQLTPVARAKVEEILGPDQTMVTISSWADEVRRGRPDTANWHFIDIPIAQKRLKMARDCVKDNCVVAELRVLQTKLQDPATPAPERKEALMFLIHFVGDMHQPLHSSDNQDRGGNSVRVVFHDRPTNLHSLWDSGLLNRMPPEDELYKELSADALQHAKKWRKGSFADWANDSHDSARKMVYGMLPKAEGDAPRPISAEYEANADPLIKVQLAKAGDRLAAVLNRTLR